MSTETTTDRPIITDEYTPFPTGRVDFPTHLIPGIGQRLIKELDKHCAYPTAVTGVAILAAAGAAIGNNTELFFKNEWIEAPVLYVCVVGDKGSGKSHAISTILKALFILEGETFKTYTAALAAWQSNKDQAKIDKQPFSDPAPTWERYTVDSFTIEKLSEILNENQRGVIVYNDELRGWFKSFTQYDNDSTDKWLKMFNRFRIIVDRIGRGTTQINKPFCSVIGTVQPEVLDRLITPDFRECGLIDRILFVKIDTELKYSAGDVDAGLLMEWFNLIRKLIAINDRPRYVYLSNVAKAKFTDWKKAQIEYLNNNENERILGGKFDNYLLRIALILHVLENVHEDPFKEISGDTFDRAILFIGYFQNQYYRLFGEKDIYQIRQMTEQQKCIYKDLPGGEFTTREGVATAACHGMEEKTFKRLLNRKELFKRVRHGLYEKVFEL